MISQKEIQILLVEDDEVDGIHLERVIAKIESSDFIFHIKRVATLKNCLVSLKDCLPDILLLDVNLPDSKGIYSLQKIKLEFAVPIILLSGDSNPNLIHLALQQGAQDYLIKGTFDYSELFKSIIFSIERYKFEKLVQIKSNFLNIMSHEIRTPLNGILTLSEVLWQSEKEDKKRKKIKVINDCGHSLLQLIDDLLDLSKLEAGIFKLNLQSFHLEDLLKGVVHSYEDAAEEKGISIRLDLDERVEPVVHTDAKKLRQVMLNLVSNAIKFTEKGEVTIFVESSFINDFDGKLSIQVKDTGCGISASDIKRVFDPMFQGDNSRNLNIKGTGLGLSICKELCQAMGGDITVESNINIGTIFKLNLPLMKGKTARPDHYVGKLEDVQEASFASNYPLEILLVNDNKIDLSSDKLIFEHLGYSIQSAENGMEAFEKVMSSHFDLVLMDINMPILNGVDSAERIKSELGEKAPIVIALSAYSNNGFSFELHDIGMYEYIQKPINIKLLRDVLKKVSFSKSK